MVLSLLLLASLAVQDGAILVDWPEKAVRSKPDRCPIVLHLPLEEQIAAKRNRYSTERLQGVRCLGVRIQKLRLTVDEGRWNADLGTLGPGKGRHVTLRADVFLPKGRDRLVTLTYKLLAEGGEIGSGSEVLEADEGELNWGDGVAIELAAPPTGKVVLEIGLAVADR